MKIGLVILALVIAMSGCTRSNRGHTVPVLSEMASPTPLHGYSVTDDSPATNASRNAESEQVIREGNILLITFSDLSSGSTLPAFDQQVKDDGSITLIYKSVFQAARKKTGDLEKEIRDFYVPVCFASLTVRVRISSENRFVYVDGEFRKPGRYSWTSGMTLKDAIDLAHGISAFAARLTIVHADGTKQRIQLPFDRIPLDNPELKAGDLIHCRGALF
jgi:protein involved in polysaccharide export with SLBB domain